MVVVEGDKDGEDGSDVRYGGSGVVKLISEDGVVLMREGRCSGALVLSGNAMALL